MNVSIGARSDKGHRSNNEDRIEVIDTRRKQMRADSCMILADGMGGREKGERASGTAVQTVTSSLMAVFGPESSSAYGPLDKALLTAMEDANARVFELANDARHGNASGMGTTCLAAMSREDDLVLANVGDSRAYLLRDGVLQRVTKDHSYVAEQQRAGLLSDHAARNNRYKNVITRAVGIESEVETDVYREKVKVGDILMMCTDGLSGVVDEGGIAQILLQTEDTQEACERLVEAAKRSGSSDNISVIVARFGTEAPKLPGLVMDASGHMRPVNSPSLTTILVIGAVLVVLLAAVGALLISRSKQRLALVPMAAGTQGLSRARALVAASPAYSRPQTVVARPLCSSVLMPISDGFIVMDAQTSKLIKVDYSGNIVRWIPVFGTSSDIAATGSHISLDQEGDIFEAPGGGNSLIEYSPSGEMIRIIGHGQLVQPNALSVDPSGTIWVIDDHKLKKIVPLSQSSSKSSR